MKEEILAVWEILFPSPAGFLAVMGGISFSISAFCYVARATSVKGMDKVVYAAAGLAFAIAVFLSLKWVWLLHKAMPTKETVEYMVFFVMLGVDFGLWRFVARLSANQKIKNRRFHNGS